MPSQNTHMGASKNWVRQNGWFIMENPNKMDDLRGKPTILGNPHMNPTKSESVSTHTLWDVKSGRLRSLRCFFQGSKIFGCLQGGPQKTCFEVWSYHPKNRPKIHGNFAGLLHNPQISGVKIHPIFVIVFWGPPCRENPTCPAIAKVLS